MDKNQKIAQGILEKVGGVDNVANVVHCMTRLRFDFKDRSLVDEEGVKQVPGVLGCVNSGGQFQVIIGQNVPHVYKVICDLGNFEMTAAIDENLDAPKGKLTPKGIWDGILNYMSASMSGIIPMFMAAAMFKTLSVVLGPEMLKMITAESDLYILLDFLHDGCFYFMPIYLGYTASRKLNANPIIGMYLGGILLAPDFIAMIGVKEAFTVFGLNAPLNNYSSTILPMLIGVWVMSLVEKLLKKYVPEVLSTVFVPFLTVLIMLPIMFCFVAPLGNNLGALVGDGLIALATNGGFIAVGIIAAIWLYLVMAGMHLPVLMFAIMGLLGTGNPDTCVIVAGSVACWAGFGVALGAFLRMKDKQEKSLAMSYFVSATVGGISEPWLYGIAMKYKRPFIGMMAGGLVGGLYAGLMKVELYMLLTGNVLNLLAFVSGGTANLVNAAIAHVLAMVVAGVVTYVLGGFDKKVA